jgi:hypothetical protein
MNPDPHPPPEPEPDSGPGSSGHGLNENPVGRDAEREAWLAYRDRYEDDEPEDFEDEEDYEDSDELAGIIAEAGQAVADHAAAEAHIAARGETAAMAAVASAAMGRRGPGQPGSADPLAGEYGGPEARSPPGRCSMSYPEVRCCWRRPSTPPATMTGSTGSRTTNCSGSSAPRTAARPPRRR